MYQSVKTYPLDEFEELILNISSYSALKKSSYKEIYFISTLKDLDELPEGTSFAVPGWLNYDLELNDVKFEAKGIEKIIELLSSSKHEISICCPVKPSLFWKDYADLWDKKLSVFIAVHKQTMTFRLGFEYLADKDEYKALIAKMSQDGFRVQHNEGFDTLFILEIDNYDLDETKKIIYKYVTEESIAQPLEGDLTINLIHDKNIEKRTQFESELIFWGNIINCISKSYIPSEDFDELNITYLSDAYSLDYWDLSKSILNTEHLEVPVGKLNDNGPRDHYIISKKVFKDGYKLLVEHSKFPDAELPEQFTEVDFEIVED
jgi:hypothetical protein